MVRLLTSPIYTQLERLKGAAAGRVLKSAGVED
jgi:hypothetical protein